MKSKRESVKDVVIGYVDFVQSLIFIVSIVNAIIAPIVKKFKDIALPSLIRKYVDFFDFSSTVYWINCIIMALFVIKLIYVITKKNRNSSKELIDIIDCIHTNYIHCMRDHMHQLEETENLLSKDINDDVKKFERYYNDEYKRLESIAQECVNQVSNVLNKFVGMPEKGKDSICTCIKMISINEKDKPIAERSLITLSRSENSSNKRRIRKNKKDIIGENTDFLDLSNGYRNYFYGVGLKEKYKRGEYKNSTLNFSYESTIVVPIRYTNLKQEVEVISEKGRKRIEITVKNDIDIVGYLCIDTEKKIYDWKKRDEVKEIVKILALYADTLYVYLSAFRKTFEKGWGNKC